MKPKFLKKFKYVEKGFLYYNRKRISVTSIYDTISLEELNYVLDNCDKLRTQCVEVCFDERDEQMLRKVDNLGFRKNYHWFLYNVKKEDAEIIVDENISLLKRKKEVKTILTEQCHELAKRDPFMFDESGNEKGWWKCGRHRLVYRKDKKILSVLTFQKELGNNLHIYLTYTLPEYRSQGLGTKLIDWLKKYASAHNFESITVCTDTTKENRVPNMLIKNGFDYLKTGYEKLLK